MKFDTTMAASLGLVVGGKSGTALVNPVYGFSGRRIYVDGGSKALSMAGPLIHLSGFTPAECEKLGASINVAGEYSARVTAFLKMSPENLAAAAKIVRTATSPAHEPTSKKVQGVDMSALFAAAAEIADDEETDDAIEDGTPA